MKRLLLVLVSVAALVSCETTVPSASSREETLYAPGQPTPVSVHGALSVSGSQLVDKNNQAVQLKGMSLFWSQWGGQFYNTQAVEHTRAYWNASVVRAAMGIENGGYLTNADAEKQKVKDTVAAAVASGVYVIIDWHDHHAEAHTAEAEAFFAEMARDYKATPNVLFEVYNEPLNTVSWADVKTYATTIVKAIRNTGAPNVILIGSPTWSQNVDLAAADPVSGTNLAYTLHFYAGTHKQWLRDRADAALAKGIALFVSEWGTCDASGNGGFSPEESDAWMAWMQARHISWCNWALNDKNETASALKPGSSGSGGWTLADLTPSGLYVRDQMRR